MTVSQTRNAKAMKTAAERAKQPTAAELAAVGVQMSKEIITPELALQYLKTVASDPTFRQRPANQNKIAFYVEEMTSGQWVEYLPDGVISFDEKGVLINGQKRMLAIIESGKPIGFVVARNCPRRMFAYFDQAQNRTGSDTFAIAGLPSGPDVQSAVRLAMAFESMVRGAGDRSSWAAWGKGGIKKGSHPLTPFDLLSFYQRRPLLGELLQEGRSLTYGARLTAASVMVFHFYADKAWPDRPKDSDGFDPLETFLHSLRDGEHLGRTDPAHVLREWSKDTWARKEKVAAKREVHLFLLFKYWSMYALGEQVKSGRVQWQPTWPMPYPFHPSGDAVAVENVLKA